MPESSTAVREILRAFRHRMPLVRTIGVLLIAAPSSMTWATEPSLLSEQEFLAELPVVLTASRMAQPQAEAPAAVSVIDRQMIEASGARNLSEVFRLVPGFQVGFENGHRHVVGYHGLADEFSRRLQVLIDGRSVYLPSFGGVSWSDLPVSLDDIERIEVIRGPNAVTYGANSFLAVINITTRHSAADRGGFVRATVGSNDIRDGVLRVAGGDGDVSYRLTTGYQQDNGYGQHNDSRRITFMNGRMDARSGERDDIEFQFGYNEGPRGRGYAGSLDNYPHDQEITSRFQQLRWRHRLESGDEVAVQFYYNHHESDEQFLSEPIAALGGTQLPLNYDVRSERYDAELQHIVGIGETARLVWGAGARLDRVEWPGFLGTPDAIDHHHYRLFGNLEWRATERLLFNVGAMYEHSSITGHDLSPRLAANYRLAPGHTLRASVSSATRQPVLLEEQSFARFCLVPTDPTCSDFTQTFASSGNLDPEEIISGELGYLGRLTPTVSLDLRVFNDQVTRLIGVYDAPYPEPVPPGNGVAFDFRNSGKARIMGSEVQMQWQPQPGTRVLFGYANVNVESNNADDAWYSRSAPRNSLSLFGLREFPGGWQASGGFFFQDEMLYLDGHDLIDTVWRVDLRAARRFQLAGSSAEAALVLQNVLDPQPDYYPDSVPPRIGYFTVSLQTH